MQINPEMTRRQFLKKLSWIAGTFIVGTGTYSLAVEPRWFEVRRIKIKLSGLPVAFNGMKLIQFSDTHIGFHFSLNDLETVVKQINELRADMVCFTGDLLDDQSGLPYLPEVTRILSQIKAPLGKWAVLGNHDYWTGVNPIHTALTDAGFRLLKNQHTVIEKGTDLIYMIGLDDVLEGEVNVDLATKMIPQGVCKILLVHEPDFADHLPSPVDLQLSGHSHGGQILLPFGSPLVTPPLGSKYPIGLYTVNNTILYTNKGLGTTILPFRFWCRPEITLVTLNR